MVTHTTWHATDMSLCRFHAPTINFEEMPVFVTVQAVIKINKYLSACQEKQSIYLHGKTNKKNKQEKTREKKEKETKKQTMKQNRTDRECHLIYLCYKRHQKTLEIHIYSACRAKTQCCAFY